MTNSILIGLLFVAQINSMTNIRTKISSKLGFSQKPMHMASYKLPGLSKSIREDLYTVIKSWQSQKTDFTIPNRLLFHGRPGNGKSVVAKAIAEGIDANFFEASGSSIINSMQGSGATTIQNLFNKAIQFAEESDKISIIFIDEIDGIGVLKNSNNKEHENAIQELWKQLDKVKNNNKIKFICATNKFKDLHTTFLERFSKKTGIFRFSYPDVEYRKEIIAFFLIKFELKLEKNTSIEFLAQQTNGLSIRDIKEILIAATSDSKKANPYFDEDKVIQQRFIIEAINIYKKNKPNVCWEKTKENGEKVLNVAIKVAGLGANIAYIYNTLKTNPTQNKPAN